MVIEEFGLRSFNSTWSLKYLVFGVSIPVVIEDFFSSEFQFHMVFEEFGLQSFIPYVVFEVCVWSSEFQYHVVFEVFGLQSFNSKWSFSMYSQEFSSYEDIIHFLIFIDSKKGKDKM